MTYLVMNIMFIGGFLFGYLAGYGTYRREAAPKFGEEE